MTVKELMEVLNKCDPDDLVILSEDPEGNSYMEAYSTERMVCQGDYHFDIGYAELTEDLKNNGYTEDDILEGGKPCIVIWP